jgi:hypothetical protein
MRTNITDRTLRSLTRPHERSREIWDTSLRGFGCRASKLGTVAFFVMKRPRGQRKFVRLTIGRYPVLTLSEARKRARDALRELHDGVDPRDVRLSLEQRVIGKALKFLQEGTEPGGYLYRHYHPGGDLLYVGISLTPLRRQDRHLKVASWRDMICRILIEPFLTREEALAAEETAIRTEFPKCNLAHNRRRHPFQELRRVGAPIPNTEGD